MLPKKLYRWLTEPTLDPNQTIEPVPPPMTIMKRPRGHPRTLLAAERTNLVIPRALNDRLDAEVKRRGVSRSQIVRGAIEKELGE